MASTESGSAQQSDTTSVHCSFCRKSYRDAGPLVEGAGTGSGSVYICEACASLCTQIIEMNKAKRKGPSPDSGDEGATGNAPGEAQSLSREP